MIEVIVNTRCTEPQRKPESWDWNAEITRGGYISFYLMDGLLILKKIEDGNAAPAAQCSQAHTPTEGALCANPALKTLDSQMAQAYHQAFARTAPKTPERQALIQSQRDWLRTRDACKADVPCLEKAYQSRIRVLQDQGRS